MEHAKIVETRAELIDCLDLRKSVFVEEHGVPLELEVDAHDDENPARRRRAR